MATIINTTPGQSSTTDSGVGMVLGAIIILLALAAFFVYGLPALRNQGSGSRGANINVTVPTPNVNPIPNPSPNPTP